MQRRGGLECSRGRFRESEPRLKIQTTKPAEKKKKKKNNESSLAGKASVYSVKSS